MSKISSSEQVNLVNPNQQTAVLVQMILALTQTQSP